MVTDQELRELKRKWLADPIWDIEETQGFEEHQSELIEFREKHERVWDEMRKEKEERENQKARNMGVEGLYQLILEQKNLIDRQHKAMDLLCEGKEKEAYRALNYYE